jgi:hypothetical protein
VVEQVKMMKEYKLRGTFLLQYDALMDSNYQKLLKSLPADSFEIGAWWEIPQPLVENSGMVWRGRYPWDWHADVGFATGYTPEEREKLVDTYMYDFKRIFGYYPKSVGSWFIDAHTLSYLYQKYDIVASCNCKDQIGTDGYTMWGGYWNQAYYPSKKNAYMPAQNKENQIPVPVFRMLGSDPIHQYDNGLGSEVQRVVSLEPVYGKGGGDSAWVGWYFKEFLEGAAMEYAYVQTGQENSFTWSKMRQGFTIQMPLIARLRDEDKVRVETLAESGAWFRNTYEVTPATSVTVMSDHSEKNLKTVWFNSRFFRANLLWQKGNLRFRDIHIFNENMESNYLRKKTTSNKCDYYTLPVVDGFTWSSSDIISGLRFKAKTTDGVIDITGGFPEINDSQAGILTVNWPLTIPEGTLRVVFDEDNIFITLDSNEDMEWFLELTYDKLKDIPFEEISDDNINCQFMGFNYSIKLLKGNFTAEAGSDIIIIPDEGNIIFDLSQNVY